MMILLVALIACIALGRINGGPAFFLVAFPGVVLHELSHFIIAVILRCNPEPISLIPRKDPDGVWVLGSVTFYPSWWNAGFVALAPLYVLPAVGWVLFSSLEGESAQDIFIGGYILACIAWGSAPSPADWKIALSRPIGTLVLLLGLGWLLHAMGLEIFARWNA